MRAARRSRRNPAGRCGPERPLPEPAGCGEAGTPLWVRSSLGWARSPAGPDAAGAAGGRARGRRAGLSFVRGFARRGRASRGYRPPPLALLGGGALPRALGRGGRGLGEASGWRPDSLAPNRAEAPPPPPRPPILSAAPSLSAWVAPFPCSRGGSASALLPLALRVALPGFQGGCPGGAARRGGAGKGEESRPPAQHLQRAAGERAALCEGGGLAPARPERSLLFPARSLHAGTVTAAGGEDGGAAGPAVAENRGGCLTCSPRRGGCGPGTGGGGGGGAHSTRDSAAGGTN